MQAPSRHCIATGHGLASSQNRTQWLGSRWQTPSTQVSAAAHSGSEAHCSWLESGLNAQTGSAPPVYPRYVDSWCGVLASTFDLSHVQGRVDCERDPGSRTVRFELRW